MNCPRCGSRNVKIDSALAYRVNVMRCLRCWFGYIWRQRRAVQQPDAA